jgi:hypothetical protein
MKYAYEGAIKSQLEGTTFGNRIIESLFGDTDLSVLACCLILLGIVS